MIITRLIPSTLGWATKNASQVQRFLKLTSAVRNNRCYTVAKGSLSALPPKIRSYVEEKAALCQPDAVYICDGSEQENKDMIATLRTAGVFEPLPKYENCWLAGTDPSDVARVESKTFIVTSDKRETTPTPVEGVEGQLNIWKSPAEYENEFNSRFPGCMKGRTMYVLPFSMGPVGSPLSKIGIQLTDSPYVVTSTRIMTRMGADVLKVVDENTFIKALHSVGCPLPLKEKLVNNWPCNPKQVMVAHIPDNNEIASFGSGYGGNSLLGKKCFALRLGSILAHREGWLAEHMLILGITNPEGHKRYIAAAFPSQCGKTNLAMMQPSLPGYKIECVGDDIAWMRFDKEGRLRAINPEAGFFGVAPGTSMKTNPQAMMTIKKNTVFTNVAKTSDGGVYWEDIDEDAVTPGATITSWTGKENWSKADGKPAAHPNSRFCTPAGQCPIIDPAWEDSAGVPIDAIIFGGRRPQGVPLVYESYNWQHGVFVGASMRSESTSAAEHKGKMIMHDPFAMRPFFGYNFGDYIKHWLSFAEQKPALQLPKVFHVNWFRKNAQKKFVWPGFGENVRVLDWVIKRVENQDVADKSAIGYVPKAGTLNTEGLTDVDTSELFALDRDFLLQESEEIGKYFREQVNSDLPEEMWVELENLRKRASDM